MNRVNNRPFRINTILGIPRFVEITPENGGGDVVAVFTSGNCHSFALALNKLTGWTLCACFRVYDGDNIPVHVFVQNDRGNYIDVEGEKTPEQFARRWSGDIKPITRKDILNWVRAWKKTRCGYIPTRVKDSIPYAQKLIDNNLEEDTWRRTTKPCR